MTSTLLLGTSSESENRYQLWLACSEATIRFMEFAMANDYLFDRMMGLMGLRACNVRTTWRRGQGEWISREKRKLEVSGKEEQDRSSMRKEQEKRAG